MGAEHGAGKGSVSLSVCLLEPQRSTRAPVGTSGSWAGVTPDLQDLGRGEAQPAWFGTLIKPALSIFILLNF